jgi:hypothetical protein
MWKRLCGVAMSLTALSASACGGFASARDLERMERGPAACSQSCHDLGMRMGALALIDKQHSGCVCVPNDVQAENSSHGGAVVAATAMLADEAARQQQQQQQQQQARRQK